MQWFMGLVVSLTLDSLLNLIDVPPLVTSDIFIGSFAMACACLIPSRIFVRTDEDRFWLKRAGLAVRVSFYIIVGIALIPMFPNLEPPPTTP